MKIQIITSLEDAQKARGLTVVIDVLRAFTTTCFLFANGVKEIISVADLDTAYAIKKAHPSYLLIGEKGGIKPSDFDWDNSPTKIGTESFNSKTAVFTTSCGTEGIEHAVNADEIITGAFVNAGATARFIRKQEPEYVTLLCTNKYHPENEDVMCAKYIQALLQGRNLDFESIKTYMKTHPSADGFLLHPLTNWSRSDFRLCMTLDTFDFVIKVKKGNPIVLERI